MLSFFYASLIEELKRRVDASIELLKIVKAEQLKSVQVKISELEGLIAWVEKLYIKVTHGIESEDDLWIQ